MGVDVSCFAVDPNPAGKATKSRCCLQAVAIEVMLAVPVPCTYSVKTKEGNWSTGQPGQTVCSDKGRDVVQPYCETGEVFNTNVQRRR